VKLQFHAHYGEKDLTLQIPRDAVKASKSFVKINIIWSPYTKQWETVQAYDAFTNKELGSLNEKAPIMVEPKITNL